MSTEQTTEQPDVVAEARELLGKVTLPGEVNARAADLLPALCDEIEAHREHLEFCFHNHVMESELSKLREQIATQAQSIKEFQAEQRAMRKAITNALPWFNSEVERLACYTHDQPSHCVDCDLRHKAITVAGQLRQSITSKGSEQ